MSSIKLIQMYASPWAERVRWVLNFKGLPFEKQNYQPGVDEEAVKKLTGQAQVPVLLVDGTVIPDSTAIVNWLEQHHPQPALMPTSEKDHAQAMLWEELMDGVLGPQARMLIIGHFLRSSEPELQQGGRYFAQKYQHTSYAEERAKVTVERILTILKHALDGRQYLVGDTFTRADLTAASDAFASEIHLVMTFLSFPRRCARCIPRRRPQTRRSLRYSRGETRCIESTGVR